MVRGGTERDALVRNGAFENHLQIKFRIWAPGRALVAAIVERSRRAIEKERA